MDDELTIAVALEGFAICGCSLYKETADGDFSMHIGLRMKGDQGAPLNYLYPQRKPGSPRSARTGSVERCPTLRAVEERAVVVMVRVGVQSVGRENNSLSKQRSGPER